jgi:glucose-6-phosphate 1-dehydrogenase
MRFRFNPMIEIGLGARAKIPGEANIGEQRELFLSNEFPDEMSPYERLLGDALAGEGLLFARQDGVEEAWRVVDKVLTHHHVAHSYPRGSWGPKEANRMIEPFGGWHDPIVTAT